MAVGRRDAVASLLKCILGAWSAGDGGSLYKRAGGNGAVAKRLEGDYPTAVCLGLSSSHCGLPGIRGRASARYL